MPERIPPPWSVEEKSAHFAICDRNGQALAFVYFENESGRRSGGACWNVISDPTASFRDREFSPSVRRSRAAAPKPFLSDSAHAPVCAKSR